MVFLRKNTHLTTSPLTISQSSDARSPPVTRNTCQALSGRNSCTVPSRSSSAESGSSMHTIPFMCPLCLIPSIQHPVPLHPLHTDSLGARHICQACRSCVVRWHQMCGEAEAQCPQCPVWIAPNALQERVDIVPLLEEGVVMVNCADVRSTDRCETGMLSKQGTLCGICEKNAAIEYCVPCAFPLCSQCQESSHKQGRYRTHEVVPLHLARARHAPHCSDHTVQVLEPCCFTCRESVCLTSCFGGKHKDHAVEPLTEVGAKIRLQLKADMATLEPLAAAASNLANNFEKHLTKYESDLSIVQKNIEKYFDAIRKDLKDREESLQREVLEDASRVRGTAFRYISQCRAAHSAFQRTNSVLDALFHVKDIAYLVRREGAIGQGIHGLGSAMRGAHDTARKALQRVERSLAENGSAVDFFGDSELRGAISRTGKIEHRDVFGMCNKHSADASSNTKLSLLRSEPESKVCVQESEDKISLSPTPREVSAEQFKANDWENQEKSNARLSLHIGFRATTPHDVLEKDLPSSGAESRVLFHRLSTRKRFLSAGNEEDSSASPPLSKSRVSSNFTGLSGVFLSTRRTSCNFDEKKKDINANGGVAEPTPSLTPTSGLATSDVSVPPRKEVGKAPLRLQLQF